MKVHIVVTSDAGISYEGDAELLPSRVDAPAPRRPAAKRPPTSAAPAPGPTLPDFDLPLRAFAHRYLKSLSGPKKYAVLVARLCQGRLGESISPRDVEKHWGSMTEPMGGLYNGAHFSRAKNAGWIDQPARDSVVLLKDWTDALSDK